MEVDESVANSFMFRVQKQELYANQYENIPCAFKISVL